MSDPCRLPGASPAPSESLSRDTAKLSRDTPSDGVAIGKSAEFDRSSGRNVPSADGQIAAIAAVNGLVLVTANKRDFRGFQGLRVESWVD